MELSKKIFVTLILILFVFAVSFIPYESIAVPRWKVLVVDQNDMPIVAVEVRQVWNHYSFDDSALNDQEETLVTNADGVVVFNERSVRASLVRRIFVILFDLIKPAIRHSSAGVHASVFLPGDSDKSISYNGLGEPPMLLKIDQ